MRDGVDYYHPPVRGTGETVHNIANVYGEMLRQVLRDYSGLPPFVDLEMSDIRFLYEGLRRELQDVTKPR